MKDINQKIKILKEKMLKKFLTFVSFILFTYSLFASVRSVGEMIVKWDYNLNISGSFDMAYDVTVDSGNNIIVVGWNRNAGNKDQWRIMKFNQSKNLLWNKPFPITPTQHERAYAVAVDSDDNITVVGRDREFGNYRWRIMKLNPSGDSIWNYTHPNTGTGTNEAYGVAVDSDDNITVVGHDNEPGNYQWRVIKLDKDKNLLWDKNLTPSTGNAYTYDVAIDKSDDIIVVGREWNTTSNSYQWRIMKLNPSGDSIWNYTKDLSTSTDSVEGVAVDSYNNIIVVGYDREGINNDQWRIMKLNPSGNSIWNYTVNPNTSYDRPYAVVVDSNNNIIVVGYDRNTTGTSPSNPEQWRIMKLNSSGDSMWNYTRNISSNHDRAYGVANYSNNNIIVVGYDSSSSSSDSQWRIMEFTLCGNGEVDSTSGEKCDYNAMNPDSPCLSYQYCNNVCRCPDLFDVWVEPNRMLFTIAQKTPINLYMKNTGGNDTDTYSIEAKPSNPAVIDVDVSGSSPTGPVGKGTTELVRPWVTVLATTISGKITFNVTSPEHLGKYRTATLSISEGLPISLYEFNILGLITIMILAGLVYFYVLKS